MYHRALRIRAKFAAKCYKRILQVKFGKHTRREAK